MKNFASYAANKDLSLALVEAEIDVDAFCDYVLESYENKNLNLNEVNDEVLNEFLGRMLQGAARGISGLAGGVAGMAGDAGRAAGAKAAGMAQSMRNAVGGATSAVGGALKGAGQYVADKVEAGRRAEAQRQVKDRLDGLQNALVSLGLDKIEVTKFFGAIGMHIQKAIKAGKMGTAQNSAETIRRQKEKEMAGVKDFYSKSPVPPTPAPGVPASA